MIKKIILITLILTGIVKMSAQFAASNFTMISNINPETTTNSSGSKYSACWGWYQSAKNKEYAIACSNRGTYWVDVTNPATPTVSAYRAGVKVGATWREAKTYQNYCYVISDDGGNNSFQIFDMQYLPDSVHKVFDNKNLFQRAHAAWVDGNKLYLSSVTTSASAYSTLNVYSLVNPASPVLIRRLDQDYPFINQVHDCYVRNDTVFASCAYQGLYVFKFNANNTFTQLGSLSNYQFSGYNHSSALTPNGQTLVFMDEVPNGLPIKVANVTNLSNIQVLATTNQFPQTTPHNPFIVSNQYCFVSSYQDGLQLFDISNPSAPFLAGYFDTYPAAGGNNNTWPTNHAYKGQWGAYPFFPSKNIFALDQTNGVFMLKTGLYQNPAFTSGFNSPASICVGATVNLVNTSINATTYTWTIQGGNPATSSSTNQVVSFPSAGIFTITLASGNPSIAPASASHTISVVNNNLSTVASSTNASCFTCTTGKAAVNVSGGTAPFTYAWIPAGGSQSLAINLAPACYTVNIKDANGCLTSTSTCVGFLTTGLTNFSQSESDLYVYPNPAKTLLNVEYPESTFNCALYNHIGQLIVSGINNLDRTTIDLNEFPKGIYILEVTVGTNKIRKKIIVE